MKSRAGKRPNRVGRPAYAGIAVGIVSLAGLLAFALQGASKDHRGFFHDIRLAFSSDSGAGRAIRLWDGRRYAELRAAGCGGDSSYSPAWSNDGRRLAFLTVRSGQTAVCVVDDDHHDGFRAFEPKAKASNVVWHPSGDRLLVTEPGGTGGGALVEVSLPGGDQERLVEGSQGFGRPAWKPDGSEFTVATGENHLQFYDAQGGRRDFWPDTKDQSPSWSRDGSSLAFVREEQSGWALLVMDTKTRAISKVRSSPDLLFNLDWSPDDRYIAFEAYNHRSGNADIFVTEASADASARVLFAGAGDDGSPVFRP